MKASHRLTGLLLLSLSFVLGACDIWSPAPARLPNGGAMAVGEERTAYGVSTHCGLRVLAITIAGTSWVSPDLPAGQQAPVPQGWQSAIDENERIDLVVELVGPESLLVTAVGSDETLTYAPNVDGSHCD